VIVSESASEPVEAGSCVFRPSEEASHARGSEGEQSHVADARSFGLAAERHRGDRGTDQCRRDELYASYFEIVPSERTLLPGDGARIAETLFADWFSCSTAQQQPAPSLKGA
jgi:hypothetical protein